MKAGRLPLSGAHLGLLLAALALVPALLALVGDGWSGAPASALALTQAAGALSVVAFQGTDRGAMDAPALLRAPVDVASFEAPVAPRVASAPRPWLAPRDGLDGFRPLRL